MWLIIANSFSLILVRHLLAGIIFISCSLVQGTCHSYDRHEKIRESMKIAKIIDIMKFFTNYPLRPGLENIAAARGILPISGVLFPISQGKGPKRFGPLPHASAAQPAMAGHGRGGALTVFREDCKGSFRGTPGKSEANVSCRGLVDYRPGLCPLTNTKEQSKDYFLSF
jgi:hypothetical protein